LKATQNIKYNIFSAFVYSLISVSRMSAPTVNVFYIQNQLLKALSSPIDPRRSEQEQADRKKKKSEEWSSLLQSISDRTVNIGSRQPMKGIPVWVTPHVLNGGFIHGDIGAKLGNEDRSNESYLTSEGMGELLDMYYTGKYRVVHPENAVLLIFAVLLEKKLYFRSSRFA
jgi:hypothetical protein